MVSTRPARRRSSKRCRSSGYRTINGDKPGSYPGADDGETLLRQIERGDYRLPTFELFDAFTDNPYFHLWREIYAQYPDAKYILTVRDEERWIESCASFYRNRRIRPMRVWMFGKHANPGAQCREPAGMARCVPRAQRCRARALSAVDPASSSNSTRRKMREWGPLCEFLGKPVPGAPWPHANVTQSDKPWRSAWRRVRRLLGMEMATPDDG